MSIQNILVLALGLVVIASCASDPELPNVNYPLSVIDKAIHTALLKVKSISQNKREYTSEYLTTEGRPWDPIGNEIYRATVTVTILGDRRPYDLRIESLVEEKPKGQPGYSSGFKPIGQSKKLVGEIIFRIDNYLRQTGKRNLIDDFKAF